MRAATLEKNIEVCAVCVIVDGGVHEPRAVLGFMCSPNACPGPSAQGHAGAKISTRSLLFPTADPPTSAACFTIAL